jgi:hypothetical protein
MFDSVPALTAVEVRRQTAVVAAATTTYLAATEWATDPAGPVGDPSVPDGERVERIRALEELKSACAAAQAVESAALDASVRAGRAARGVPTAERGRGVGAQVALARRASPFSGGRHLGLATALTREMPATLTLLAEGLLSEWRATIIVRETACLSREDRSAVDAVIGRERDRIAGMGDGELAAWVKAAAYRLDPHAALARMKRAEQDRTVTLRPAPDGMARLSTLMPLAQGVASWAALRKTADSARAAGDERSRGQVMADTVAHRLIGTGQPAFVGAARSGQSTEPVNESATESPIRSTRPGPVGGVDAVVAHVQLVMTDRTLLFGDDEPAWLPGYGPVPAGWARDVLRPSAGLAEAAGPMGAATVRACQAWVRRLYADPTSGELVALQSRERTFPDGLRHFLVARDRVCRTPWCDAPIRHGDHVVRFAAGGPTSADNGQGLCEACNYAEEADGWSARPSPGSRLGAHAVEITTPTGHTYLSRPPPLPGAGGPAARAAPRRAEHGPPPPDVVTASRFETEFADLLHRAA